MKRETTELVIHSGLLDSVINAIGSVDGKKPIPLSMKITRVRRAIGEYLDAWRQEELNPAIKEFTKDKDSVPKNRTSKFFKEYDEIFTQDITVEVETFTVEELSLEGLTIDDFSTALLSQVGLLVDE